MFLACAALAIFELCVVASHGKRPARRARRASACLDTALHQPGRVAEPVLDYWFGARGGARLVFTCLDRGQLGAAWAKRAQAGYRSPVAVAYETG